MSIVRNLLQELLPNHNPNQSLEQQIQKARIKIHHFSIQQLKQFVRQISFVLYKREQEAQIQQFSLQLIKQLMLGGSFPLFLFLNVYIFPWIISINRFHRQKNLNQRAKLYYRDTVADNLKDKQGKINLESYKQLLNAAQQFLIFFGENLKFHPNSKFKMKCALSKELSENLYKRQLTEYSSKDSELLQNSLKQYSSLFRQHLKLMIDFLNEKVQECFQDKQSKYQQNLYLLLSLIQISQSYCINAIVYRIGSLINSNNLQIACELIDQIMKIGQIQSTYVTNIKILPILLEFILPVDFRTYNVLNRPKEKVNPLIIHKIISYFYIWQERTKILNLSTKIYDISYGMMESFMKIQKLSLQAQLKEYKKRLTKIYDNNEAKRSFIIDQHENQEEKIVHLLRQVAFYMGNKKKDMIINENVLDELTITEKYSISHRQQKDMSKFSESLLQSIKNRSWENSMNISGKSNEKPKDNIYTQNKDYKNTDKMNKGGEDLYNKNMFNQYVKDNYLKNQSNFHESANLIIEEPIPQVMAKQFSKSSFKADMSPIENMKLMPNDRLRLSSKESILYQMPLKEISFYSSQFSQIENHGQPKNKSTESIYIEKDNKRDQYSVKQQDSGQFMYFQKDSKIFQDNDSQTKKQNTRHLKSSISFNDSLKLNDPQEEEQILQYGMDIKAKLPETIKKPKFGFTYQDINTNTSSDILKEMNEIDYKKNDNKRTPLKVQKIMASPLQQKINQLKQSTNPSQQSNHIKGYNRIQENISPQKTANKYNFSIKKPSQPDSQDSRHVIEEEDSIYNRRITFKSESQIRQNSIEPNLISKSNSVSSGTLPKNFASLFRKKSQKASSILSSSRSLNKMRHKPQPKITIPDFTKLHELQNQLGKLKMQTEQYQKLLKQKDKELQSLQKNKNNYDIDPYQIRKQNQLMKILISNKQKKSSQENHPNLKTITKELKESTIRNSLSLREINNEVLKLKIESVKPYSKQFKKNVISSRCVVMKNDLFQIGYSYKNKVLTLYLTARELCEYLSIQIEPNSIIFSEQIKSDFDKLAIGKQIKFKTDVIGTKDYGQFNSCQLKIKVHYEAKLQMKQQQFSCQLPLTPYNMTKMVSSNEGNSLLNSKSQKTHYITPLYNSCQDLIKKGKQYLSYLFPKGQYNEAQSIFSLYFEWKNKIQIIHIKVKERAFRMQGIGYPLQSGRQLIETVLKLLIDNTKES